MRSLRLLCFVFVAIWIPFGSPRAAVAASDSLAPDGQPGIGTEASPRDVLKLFRKSSDDEDDLIAQLRTLEADVELLVRGTETGYRERGYFALLEASLEQSLTSLHENYGGFAAEPSSVGNQRVEIGKAFARMYFDKRFRLRRWLIRGCKIEIAELRDGLAVFEAAARGLVVLDEAQSNNLVKRIDLSSALLRAVRADLGILREPRVKDDSSEAIAAKQAAFLELLNYGDRRRREEGLKAFQAEAQGAEDQMRAVLFSARLREQVQPVLNWRVNANLEAKDRLELAREASPDRDDKNEAPREVVKLSKSKRRKLAREYALEGLALDPLNAELAWLAGMMSSLVYGELETGAHFDRFLVLRRIIYRDERSFAGRELSEREASALEYVQQLDARGEGVGGN
ncbi:MAG: hypothetical protein ACI87A_003273 [Planctomycetota bacterium]|jgi:hypothetical protein